MSERPRYWLMKTEPDVFSFDDLVNASGSTEPWNGVRNYQARNFMRDDFKRGDQVFIYHSRQDEPGVVGTAAVVREAYPDPTALDPKSKYFDEEELHERVDNTPFYEDTWGIHYVNKTTKNVKELKFREDWRKQNHNEFQHKVHPLKNQQHCYLFHHIYAHTLLAWEDIIRIEKISIDVVLSVQNNTTVNPDSKGNPVKKWKKPDYEIIHNDLPLKKK